MKIIKIKFNRPVSLVLIVVGVLFASPIHAWSAVGYAVIKSTDDTSSLSGVATLWEKENGLQVEVKLANAPAGKHGMHIHENGDCSDLGKAAGGHFNPGHTEHGFTPNDGLQKSHVGDMGNIEVESQGVGNLSVFLPGVHLTGMDPHVVGRSLIVHEKEDDFSQPTGNAGGRIGCGIIMLENDSSLKADAGIQIADVNAVAVKN